MTGRRFRVRGQAFAGENHAGEVAGILIQVGPRSAVEGPIGRLAAIVTSSDDAIIGEDLDGIITDWNRGAEVILGYTAGEAIGRPLSILFPRGQEDEMAGLLERIKAGERIEHFETRSPAQGWRYHRCFADDFAGLGRRGTACRCFQGGARYHRHETRTG